MSVRSGETKRDWIGTGKLSKSYTTQVLQTPDDEKKKKGKILSRLITEGTISSICN